MWGIGNNVALFSKNRNECQMNATMVILKKLYNYTKEDRPDLEKKITFSITYICTCVCIYTHIYINILIIYNIYVYILDFRG